MNPVQYEPRLLTPAEVAVELRVSAPTVYRMVARGELRAAKVGGQLRIDHDDLDRLLAGDKKEST